MFAIEKANLLSCLRSVYSWSIFSSRRFHWLLICFCIPLAIDSVSTVSIAAPKPTSQVVVKGRISRPNLQVGSKGEFVSELQAALKLLGFYRGEVDGVYSQNTESAVFSFQRAAGLSPNGVVDGNTWQTLFPSPSKEERSGSNDDSVNNFPAPTQISNNRSVNRATTEPIPTTPKNRPEPKPVKPPKRSSTPKKPVKKSPPQRQSATSRPRRKPRPSQATSSPKKPNIQYTATGFPILRLGMRGSEVLKLQKHLRTLGFLKTGIDGDFGPQTETAVKALQKRNGLEADGVVGGSTWQVINKQIGR